MFIRVALALVLFAVSSCKGGGGGSSSPQTPAEESEKKDLDVEQKDDNFTRLVASAKDLPKCTDELDGRIVYIQKESAFQFCDASSWKPIDLKGKDGVDGSGIAIASTSHCSKSVGTILATYDYTVFSSGDLFVTCNISDIGANYSKSNLYKAAQVGSSAGACLLTYDVDTPTAGFWTFKNSPNKQAVYEDSGSPNNGVVISFAASDCIVN